MLSTKGIRECIQRVEVIMASHSGIRARDSEGEYSRKPILKNAEGYGAWSTKMETILDADDCWEIVSWYGGRIN